MLYATKDKLYVRTADSFCEVVATVVGESLSLSKTGSALNSRPAGAVPLLPAEFIAQQGLTDGDVYPRRKAVTPQQVNAVTPKTRK